MSNTPELLPIRIYGDVTLRTTARPVKEFDAKLHKFIRDLTHTMYIRDGVGLAAPQVGKSIRIIVIDPDWGKEDAEKHPTVLINPVILSQEGEYEAEEGCLSLPDIYAKVKRFNKVKYSYTDPHGIEHVEEAEGFKAVVIQHEHDHLNGTLFVDKLGKLSLLKIKRKLNALMSTSENGVNIRTDVYEHPDHKIG